MSPKSRKRKGSINLEQAKEQIGQQHKKAKKPENDGDLSNLSHNAIDTNNEEDPSFEV